jgi:hypothetical protein
MQIIHETLIIHKTLSQKKKKKKEKKKPLHKRDGGGVVQGVGPEFKPQYH